MLVTLALAATLASLKNEHQVWKRNFYMRALFEYLAFTSASVLIFFEQTRLKHPLNLIPLSITTLWASCMLGVDVSFLKTETILIALGATVVICFAVTIVSIKAPCDSTAGLKVLLGCLMLLLILGRLGRLTQLRQLKTMLIVLLFLGFSLLIWVRLSGARRRGPAAGQPSPPMSPGLFLRPPTCAASAGNGVSTGLGGKRRGPPGGRGASRGLPSTAGERGQEDGSLGKRPVAVHGLAQPPPWPAGASHCRIPVGWNGWWAGGRDGESAQAGSGPHLLLGSYICLCMGWGVQGRGSSESQPPPLACCPAPSFRAW
ncbi:uncharacterized protein LOC128322920 isoform X2 [Hemicordylus capensis]|nr:uncharacterized protein LOC128322920 isoform X2 [Hemicordylus capensis]